MMSFDSVVNTADRNQSVTKFNPFPLALRAVSIDTVQINIGYACNMSCRHCHVKGGPARTESMDWATMEHVFRVVRENAISSVDITGGAPELNHNFKDLIERLAGLECITMVRTNLTVFHEKGMEFLPSFYGDHSVELIASLPWYEETRVDRIRGAGAFKKSIESLKALNRLGYGKKETGLILNLVFNSADELPAKSQPELEWVFRSELASRYGIEFNSLFCLTNMPLGRFGDHLRDRNTLAAYWQDIMGRFNGKTVGGLECRRSLNVGWDGTLSDCDFHQLAGITLSEGCPRHISQFDGNILAKRPIVTSCYCYICSASSGST